MSCSLSADAFALTILAGSCHPGLLHVTFYILVFCLCPGIFQFCVSAITSPPPSTHLAFGLHCLGVRLQVADSGSSLITSWISGLLGSFRRENLFLPMRIWHSTLQVCTPEPLCNLVLTMCIHVGIQKQGRTCVVGKISRRTPEDYGFL